MATVISGTGLHLPEQTISNHELAQSFNAYVAAYNRQHEQAILRGEKTSLQPSCAEFIAKASGIKSRHVVDKEGILDINTLRPKIEEFDATGRSIQADMAIRAARQALERANKGADEIQMVIAACSGFQRGYPAIAIEVQAALGIEGYAFDMNVACSSATFALFNAVNAIKSGNAEAVLIVNPEIFTAQTDFRDRKSHFLFGDAATAFIVEKEQVCRYEDPMEILDCHVKTQFSTNIENNLGITNDVTKPRPMFTQEGSKVFKEVIRLSIETIQQRLEHCSVSDLKRLWLHQANSNMIRLISTKLLGYEPSVVQVPKPIETCGNTSSCGALIAYHQNHQDLVRGDLGLLATFGAGYSLGCVILRKL